MRGASIDYSSKSSFALKLLAQHAVPSTARRAAAELRLRQAREERSA